MSTQVVVTLNSGQVVRAVSYRMAPYSTPLPAVPASPNPYAGGVFHLQTSLGWSDFLANNIANISVVPGAIT